MLKQADRLCDGAGVSQRDGLPGSLQSAWCLFCLLGEAVGIMDRAEVGWRKSQAVVPSEMAIS